MEASGGGLESRKILHSLEAWAEGKPDHILNIVSNDFNTVCEGNVLQKTRWKDLLSRVLLHSSYVYIDLVFGKLKKVIHMANPDTIVLGNSRLGCLIPYLKKQHPNCCIITHYDNVEYDYAASNLGHLTTFSSRIRLCLERKAIYKDEGMSVQNADLHLLLTKREKERLETVYQTPLLKHAIVPICLPENQTILERITLDAKDLVFLGSLWYKSNEDALLWFLDHVWEEVKKSYPRANLTIGGSRPSNQLVVRINKDNNIRLVQNYGDVKEVVCRDSIFISPIQSGSGMKVKIAEALSLGIPIIASDESLIGYETVFADPLNNGWLVPANRPEEYLNAIEKIARLDMKDVETSARTLLEPVSLPSPNLIGAKC